MNIKKTTLAAGIAAALAIGMAGQANASVYASSRLLVKDFEVKIGGTPLVANPVTTFEFTATNTATLNGSSSPVLTNTCGGTLISNDCGESPSLNATVANAPGGSVNRSENTFNFMGPSTDTYSNADSVIWTSELGNNLKSSTSQIAEAELQSTGSARSNAVITSNTGFNFRFSTTGIADLSLSFKADPALYAEINQLLFTSGSAQATLNAVFSLTNDSTGEAISWAPRGTALINECYVSVPGATCTEAADGEDLNRLQSVSSNPSTAAFSRAPASGGDPGWSAFGIDINGLTAGDWTLAFSSDSKVSVRTVPEPSILALLGLAIAGMGVVGRRRKTA